MKNIPPKMNKPTRRKVFIVVFVVFLVVASVVYILSIDQDRSDPASEKVILEAAAKEIKKAPSQLTDEDFAQITELRINTATILNFSSKPVIQYPSIADTKLLKKFTNLRELEFNHVFRPKEKIPKWMKLLARLGIITLEDKSFLDLKPLENLTHLRLLYLSYSEVKNIEPLANLVNLQTLYLDGTQVSDLEPLKNLKNLKYLNLGNCKNITEGQIKDLENTLPELEIIRSRDYFQTVW